MCEDKGPNVERMRNESNTNDAVLPDSYRYALLSLHTVVLVGGVISMSLMIRVKANVRSVTTAAIQNLIVVHLLFLLTLPFRIYYYAAGSWDLGPKFCKVVSAMIHAHMYLTFIFYVIILVHRYLIFFRIRQVEFYRGLHALLASIAVWSLVLVVVVPALVLRYGSHPPSNMTTADNKCFNFGKSISPAVVVLNQLFSAFIIIVTLALAVCQVWILRIVCKAHREMLFAQQEFLAQIKSIYFMLVIVVCFVPYNAFRIYYVNNYTDSLQVNNEIGLAVTTFSCFDMLILMI
ncbi:hypothetical protein DPEC_G00064800 [Dallia pectoralis]|uniref:Uncharacterized protein n=1 Tax=Dallia pectoralis TaxID=75939 RepID=A0ACC2H7Y0_DALPE|nr:hypothetical protein DPEC_G00064800 [Dallia pectoralis]